MIDKQKLAQAIGLIKKGGANYTYFFEKLNSPDFIAPLKEVGFFSAPPKLERTGEVISYSMWPESQYLVRMAPQDPALVCEVLKSLQEVDNPRVQDDIVDAALAMPAEFSAQLVPQIILFVESPYRSLLRYNVSKLLSHLVDGGQKEPALELLKAVLRLHPSDDEDLKDPQGYLDDYHYEEVIKESLPKFIEKYPEETLEVLALILKDYYNIKGLPDSEDGLPDDHTWFRRPAIEGHTQNWGHRLINPLIDGTRDAALAVAKLGEKQASDLIIFLESFKREIFQRIAAHILTESGALPEIGKSWVLNHGNFDASYLHHEYSRLVGKYFPQLDAAGKALYLEWVDEYEDVIREREKKNNREVSDELIKSWADHRRLQATFTIKEYLPEDWAARYQGWAKQFGETENLGFHAYSSGVITGPNSPKSKDALEKMGAQGVLSYLKTWKPENKEMMAPSPEGLGRILKEVVVDDLAQYSSMAASFIGLDPTYVRSFLWALTEAIQNQKTAVKKIDWAKAIELCEWVIQQPVEEDREDFNGDNDPHWGWARKQVASLLEQAFSANLIDFKCREKVWAIIENLLTDPDPTPEHEAKYGGNNMDPATLSLNTTRGESMHALLQYGLWVARELRKLDDKAAISFEVMPELKIELEKHLDIKQDPSLAIRSAYGRWLPWINNLDTKWLQANLANIFPHDEPLKPYRLAAWDSYIALVRPFREVLPILTGEYEKAIVDSNDPSTEKQSRFEVIDHLAAHITSYYWSGQLDLSDNASLINKLFNEGSQKLREHAVSSIGRSLYKSNDEDREDIEEETKALLKELWEKRLEEVAAKGGGSEYREELADFGWWFCSDVFGDEEALDLLVRTVRLSKDADPDHLITEKLGNLSDAYPDLTFECLDLILRGVRERKWILYFDQAKAEIIKKALEKGNEDVQGKANALINWLVANGFNDYRNLINQ